VDGNVTPSIEEISTFKMTAESTAVLNVQGNASGSHRTQDVDDDMQSDQEDTISYNTQPHVEQKHGLSQEASEHVDDGIEADDEYGGDDYEEEEDAGSGYISPGSSEDEGEESNDINTALPPDRTSPFNADTGNQRIDHKSYAQASEDVDIIESNSEADEREQEIEEEEDEVLSLLNSGYISPPGSSEDEAEDVDGNVTPPSTDDVSQSQGNLIYRQIEENYDSPLSVNIDSEENSCSKDSQNDAREEVAAFDNLLNSGYLFSVPSEDEAEDVNSLFESNDRDIVLNEGQNEIMDVSTVASSVNDDNDPVSRSLRRFEVCEEISAAFAAIPNEKMQLKSYEGANEMPQVIYNDICISPGISIDDDDSVVDEDEIQFSLSIYGSLKSINHNIKTQPIIIDDGELNDDISIESQEKSSQYPMSLSGGIQKSLTENSDFASIEKGAICDHFSQEEQAGGNNQETMIKDGAMDQSPMHSQSTRMHDSLNELLGSHSVESHESRSELAGTEDNSSTVVLKEEEDAQSGTNGTNLSPTETYLRLMHDSLSELLDVEQEFPDMKDASAGTIDDETETITIQQKCISQKQEQDGNSVASPKYDNRILHDSSELGDSQNQMQISDTRKILSNNTITQDNNSDRWKNSKAKDIGSSPNTLEKETAVGAQGRPSTASTIELTASGSATSSTSSWQSWPNTTKSKYFNETDKEDFQLDEKLNSYSAKIRCDRIEELTLNNTEITQCSIEKVAEAICRDDSSNSSLKSESPSTFQTGPNFKGNLMIGKESPHEDDFVLKTSSITHTREVVDESNDIEEKSIYIEDIFTVDSQSRSELLVNERSQTPSPLPFSGQSSADKVDLNVDTKMKDSPQELSTRNSNQF
jgi:hypothetical protein